VNKVAQKTISTRIQEIIGIEFNPVNHIEKIVSMIGGFIGILLVTWISWLFVGMQGASLLVASMGASAVLLFAVPHGPLSQPWPLVGGHLLSAVIGVTCYQLVPDIFIAGALAVALAIAAMHYLDCIHPPGGATALTAVAGGTATHTLGYTYVIAPVLLNVVIILLVAIFVNLPFPWRRYPASLAKRGRTTQNPEPQRIPLSHADLEYALRQMNSFIDITEDDLEAIYTLAMRHAEHVHVQPSEVSIGHCYSNGRFGPDWAVRQVVDESPSAKPEEDMITFKVIAGKGRRRSASCTRKQFARWARYKVFRNENSWQQVA
jgi:CBS domain-containing membrane protein